MPSSAAPTAGPAPAAPPGAPTAAFAVIAKAPRPGRSKTRLAKLVGDEVAAALSAAFIRDVAGAVEAVPAAAGRRGVAAYAPAGAEGELAALLPAGFGLLLQEGPDFGAVLRGAARDLLGAGFDAAFVINSDSPTLPPLLLAAGLAALRRPGPRAVMAPATDGGYVFLGVKADVPALYDGVPWSTPEVAAATVERAAAAGLPLDVLPTWYDVDDADTLALLRAELAGHPPAFAAMPGGPAPATRAALAAAGLL